MIVGENGTVTLEGKIWKLVPEEPTDEMLEAIQDGGEWASVALLKYGVLLAASPPPPAGAAGGGSGDLGALSAAVWSLLREWDTADELPESLELRLSAFETAWLRFEGEHHRNADPTPDLGAQGEPVAQGTLADEPYDPLKAAVWQALTPFMVEMMQTGGVTFMGLRNAVVAAVRPLYEAPAAPRTGSGVSVEEIARTIDAVEVGYSINLKSLTPEGRVYTLDLGDGSELREFSDNEDARDFALRHWSLVRARAVHALFAQAPRDGGETLETIAEWCEQTFGPIQPSRIVSRAAEEMDELRAEPTKVEEAADVVIVLARYPGLWAEIQRKMKINRARKWRLMGDGTGYHIKATPPSGVETIRQDNTSGGK